MIAPIVLFVVVLFVVGHTCYRSIAAHRLHNCSWNDLVSQLEGIPKVTVAQVGDEYLNPRPNQIATEPIAIWVGLGGLEGIRRMRRNARILIALAAYAERWNFTESVIVKERMRRDALLLQRATLQIIMRTALRVGQLRVVFHLQESVGAYHLMTKRLLALYEHSHAGLYPRLVQVLGYNPPPYSTRNAFAG